MTSSPVPGQGLAVVALDEQEPPGPQGPSSLPPSPAPRLSRELDAIVGEHLYSARVAGSPGQEGEAGVVRAAGAAAQSQAGDGSTVLLPAWLETAHQSGSLGLQL